jgi:hypothetical protein
MEISFIPSNNSLQPWAFSSGLRAFGAAIPRSADVSAIGAAGFVGSLMDGGGGITPLCARADALMSEAVNSERAIYMVKG